VCVYKVRNTRSGVRRRILFHLNHITCLEKSVFSEGAQSAALQQHSRWLDRHPLEGCLCSCVISARSTSACGFAASCFTGILVSKPQPERVTCQNVSSRMYQKRVAGRSRDRIPVGRGFPWPPRQPLACPTSYTRGTASFYVVERLKSGLDHRSLFSAEVKERVKLYLYTLWVSWSLLRQILPFASTFTYRMRSTWLR
jgi:hypothetical protein